MNKNEHLYVDRIEVTALDKRCLIFACEHSVSRSEKADYECVLIGNARWYGTDTYLTAADVLNAYQGDIASLYTKLAGFFVLFFFNKQESTLSVVNDHLALIPCYYTEEGENLFFSCSLKPLEKAVTLETDPQAIYHYCYFHCIPAPSTIYKDVKKLCPAELLQYSQSKLSAEKNLYRPEFSTKLEPNALSQACADVLQLIRKAVELNLSGENGAFLSGGLDSSTVAGVFSELSERAKTFSVGFNEPGYDETEYAQITAHHFQTDHEAVYLEQGYIVNNFSRIAGWFDEPFGNSSALAAYFCAKHAKDSGINTMLAGDGGDELFAGNSRYAKQKLFEPYTNMPSSLQHLLKGIFVKTPLSKLPGFKKVASYILQAENPLPDRLQSYNFMHRFPLEEIFTEDFLRSIDSQKPLVQLRERYNQANSKNGVDKMLYLDWKFTLADNDLVKVSRMCEFAGVNVRYPLLEKELVDFSCTIPARIKLPGQKLRAFYKKAMKGFLAEQTLSKSKHGFGLPFGRWMRTTPELIQLTEKTLQSLKQRNIVTNSFIDKALLMQKDEHSAYYGELIWILMVLELWLQSRNL